ASGGTRSHTCRHWRGYSGLEGKLLERVAVRRSAAAADRKGPSDLTDVDGALGVHRETVRRGKAASGRGVRRAPAGEQATIRIENTHPTVARLRNGTQATGDIARVPPELGHVRPALGVKDDVGRSLGVRPHVQMLAVRTEDLDTVALPVTHEDASIRRHGDTMRQIELPRTTTRRPPRALELSGGGKLMHAAVPVAIRHIEVAFRAHGDIGGTVEGAGAPRDRHEVPAVIAGVRRRVHDPQGQEQLARRRKLPDGVVAVVRAEDRAVGTDGDAMGTGRELALAPRAQKVPLLIVDNDRVVPATNEV